jgi:UvrD/REP helicase N-terminal domain/UvrD-like helicase C-terminal domain
MSLEATQEQRAAREVFTSGADLALVAGAGTGKTSTLMMMAEATSKRGLYMAYNKTTADDAKRRFSGNVECRTAHSLAFTALGWKYRDRLDAPRLPPQETTRLLGVTGNLHAGTRTITVFHQARLVMGMIRRFCYTNATEVMAGHMEAVNGLEPAAAEQLARMLLPYAQKAWEDIRAPDGRLRFVPDHYLKMWALTKPELPYEFIMLDEAQDTNPVLEEIFLAQPAQRVCVGDPAQQIYAWRSARDVMTSFPAQHLSLTRSFRFGPRIAEVANRWLSFAGSPMRLTGAGPAGSRIGKAAHSDAVLCRSNADVMTEVLAFLRSGVPVAIPGGGDQLRAIAEAALQLKAGQRTSHPELFLFKSWGEVQDYAENDSAGQDLRAIVQLVDTHGAETIISAVARLSAEHEARVIASTAHKAKGREWPSVRIGPGFEPPADIDGGPGPLNAEEARLIYVAVTRARELLDPAGLSWAEDYEISQESERRLIDLPLTGQLKYENAPISLFLARHLPDTHRVVQDYHRRIAGLPVPVQPKDTWRPAWPALGHAIDYRLRLSLGCPLGDPVQLGIEVVASDEPLPGAPNGRTRTALAATGHHLLDVVDRFLAGTLALEDRWLTRLCFVASCYEDVYRTGEVAPNSMLRDASPRTDLRTLVKTVPAYVVADIAAQLELARPVFTPFRALPPPLIACGPTFAGSTDIGGADADFIVDGLLLDCKATTTPTRLGSTEIGQLAGYLLLDYDDRYRITQVGLYLSRQGTAIAWQVPEFLGLLGTEVPLPQLRGRLREYLRRGQ